MKTLTTDEVRQLSERREGPCVSIYMPTHRIYEGQQEDQARFKNLVRQAEQMLSGKGLRDVEIDALMKSSRELVDVTEFWRHSDHGMALLVAKDFMQPYRLPFAPPELVTVMQRFHLKPLLRLLVGDGIFFVLALSQNSVRLLEGTQHEVRRVELKDLPASLSEALKYDDPERQLQAHTGVQEIGSGPGIGGQRASIFHGQGIGKDDAKDRVLRFFRAVDRGLHEYLRERREPLVLAGVEGYFALYREANTYAHLLDEGVRGSPERMSDEELHSKAWAIVEPWFWKEQEKEAERYRKWAGTGMTANQLADIIPAAFQGRIESLILAMGAPQWGTVHPRENRVELHDQEQPGDEDLLDTAAIQTMLHGGKVFVVEPERVPENRLATAVLRY